MRETEVQIGNSGFEENRKVLLPVGPRFTLRQQQQLYPVYEKEFSGNISIRGFPILLNLFKDDLQVLEAD